MNKMHFYHVQKTGGRSLIHGILAAMLDKEHGDGAGMEAYRRTEASHGKPILAHGFRFASLISAIPRVPSSVAFSWGHIQMQLTKLHGGNWTTFTVLRDPYNRAISHMRHMTDYLSGSKGVHHKNQLDAMFVTMTLDEWVRDAPAEFICRHLRTFAIHLNPDAAAKRISKLNHVLRLENFENDVAKLSERLGLDIPVLCFGPSKAQIELKPATKALLRQRLEPEYRLMRLVRDLGV